MDLVGVIETAGLTKRYPRVTALDALDVSVGEGVTGLVGANGAGKSTLIKILLGLIPATSGTAHVLDHDVGHRGRPDPVAWWATCPSTTACPADVSASDLVVHLGQMSGLPYAAARERAADVLRHVGLAEERYRPIGGYSTGHEAAGQARPGPRPRPAAGAARRADQRPGPGRARRHAGAGAPDRHRVRHRGAGHLPPARRAGADQRPRGRARHRAAAAVLGHHRLHARHRHAAGRGAGAHRRRPAARPGAGRGRAARDPGRRPDGRGRDASTRRRTTWSATSPSTSGSAWSGCRSGTTGSRTCSGREVPAVSSPSEATRRVADRRHPRHRLPALLRRPARRGRGRVGAVRHRAAQLLRPRPLGAVEGRCR